MENVSARAYYKHVYYIYICVEDSFK